MTNPWWRIDDFETESEIAYSEEYIRLQKIIEETNQYLCKPDITWEDIVVDEELRQSIRDYIAYFKTVKRFERQRNLVLHGVSIKIV